MIKPSLALDIVRNAKVISYDVETDGLGPEAVVVGYVIATFDVSTYTPVRHGGGGNIPSATEFEANLAEAFNDREMQGLRTVGHNLAFDLWKSQKHGVIPGAPLEDTMINEALIDDICLAYNLEACAKRHGVTPKAGDRLYAKLASRFGGLAERKQMANFFKLPGDDDDVIEYSCGDGISTLEVWQSQQADLDRMELRRVWELECALIPHLASMKRRGMKIVDRSISDQVITTLQADIDAAKSVFPHGFKVSSPKELEQMFRDNGFTDADFARTPGGKPSFTEKWLETNEVGQSILKVRKLEKAASSFITPLVDTHNINGRVHASLNQSKSDDSGAVGGRLSCSDPNLQAFPKRNKTVGKVVRQLVVADDGMLLSESDFSQQEPRLFTHYSEDSNLLSGYLGSPPLDIHTVASKVTGLPRDVAKRLGLGILTGMGSKALAGHMNWTLSEAQRGIKLFLDDAFPGIRQFQKDAATTMKRRGYVKTILGRHAHVDDMAFAYKAVSRIIQGSGADHTKTALLHACQFAESEDFEIEMLMTIHDSFIYQWGEGKEHLRTEMERILENVAPHLGIIVPIPVETGTGRNWSEASYGGKS